jgi:hypothetical protein
MTATRPADFNSRQVDIRNSYLRHLFRIPAPARSGGPSPLLPIRYLKSFQTKDLLAWLAPGNGAGAIEVLCADLSRLRCQEVRACRSQVANKCHFTPRYPDTSTGGVA